MADYTVKLKSTGNRALCLWPFWVANTCEKYLCTWF